MLSAMRFSHKLIEEIVQPGDTVVDATMGNGNDTEFLARLVGEKGTVHAFDIQTEAVENTKERLARAGLHAELHLESHETAYKYLNHNLKVAIFNLGYLPKSESNIITRASSTLPAIESLARELVLHGRIIIVVYYGHEGGLEEKEQVDGLMKKMSHDNFEILKYEMVNVGKTLPYLYAIEKKS
jgi:protein-L-isoaspartate O-methyltransferase